MQVTMELKKSCTLPVWKRGVFALILVLVSVLLTGAPAQARIMKIAVLEFDPVNEVAKDEGWGRSVADMLTAAAVNSDSFQVVERHLLQKIQSEQAMGTRETGFTSVAESIGNMVGADYVLSGSVMRQGNQLSISSRLVNVASSTILTADNTVSSVDLAKLAKSMEQLMKKMVDRVYGEAPAQPGQKAAIAPGAPLRAQVNFASGSGLTIPVSEGDTLTEQEAYYLEIAVSPSQYVYAAQLDASGALYAMFPNPAFSGRSNPVQAGVTLRVPEVENFFLDENTGKETIYVLSSPYPLDQVEQVFAGLAMADGAAMQDLAARFQAAAAAVDPANKFTLWFWHRPVGSASAVPDAISSF